MEREKGVEPREVSLPVTSSPAAVPQPVVTGPAVAPSAWPSSTDLSPHAAAAWAAMLAKRQAVPDPEVQRRLDNRPVPPLCLSIASKAPNQPTVADMATVLAVDLADTASKAGNHNPCSPPSLFPRDAIQNHYLMMKRSKLFRPEEGHLTENQFEEHEGGNILTTKVKLKGKPVPLEEWDLTMMDVYFKRMLFVLNSLGMDHLVPALLWMQAWSFGRDMADLGASISSGFVYDNSLADRMLELRRVKLRFLREKLTSAQGVSEHPAVSWLAASAEQGDWARAGLGDSLTARQIRVPGPLLPRPEDVPTFVPNDVWNKAICLNCKGDHCVYDCSQARKPFLPCTNCFWGVHHEKDCKGNPLHPLGTFIGAKAMDAMARRKGMTRKA